MSGWWKNLSGRSSLDRLAGIVLLAALVLLRAADTQPLQLLRLKVLDQYLLLSPRPPIDSQVRIVDVDEESLDTVGQWPWPRSRLAELVDGITAGGAAAIGFDILFPEHDRLSPGRIAETVAAADGELAARLRRLPSNDQLLADAMRRSRVVVSQSGFHRAVVQSHARAREQSGVAMLGPDATPFLVGYPALVRNVPELEDAAAGIGMVTIRPEADGIVRRVPMAMHAEGRILPALSLEMLRVATGQSTILIRTDEAGVNSIVLAGVPIPTDGNGKAWVPFRRHDPAIFVSAKDVLEGSVPAGTLAGKLVLIGTSATGLFDLKSTPVEPTMPGVEVHAQLLDSILRQDLLQRPNWAPGAEVVLTAGLGLALILLLPQLGALMTMLTGALTALVVTAGAWWLFLRHGLLIDFAYPLLSSLAVVGLLVMLGYWREERQRRQIRLAFGQYLSPDLVGQLAADPDRLVLGGETKTMTILFSDVRGFTTLSETFKANPQGLTALINRLLTPLSAAVVAQRGTIDKYMGDNIMAFWNAPLADERHAQHACAAALDMMARLARVNEERVGEVMPDGSPAQPMKIGIGINTGECVVGNMGSDLRFDYTVLGDSVNLASRLEGQSKGYGVTIILGEATARGAEAEFAVLPLDLIRVKGKREPEPIYTLLGAGEVLGSDAFAELARAHDGVLAGYRAQRWTEALAAIDGCRELGRRFGLDGLYDMYAERIGELMANPPPADWDGVHTAEFK